MITSFIVDEILRIISCLIKRMQLIPGPSLFHRPAKKAGLGTRLEVVVFQEVSFTIIIPKPNQLATEILKLDPQLKE